MPGVLDGIRVLDFGRCIAGPFCAALLADLGADVIRVEKVRGSEDRFIVPLTDTGDGTMFMQVNRNKRGLTLNPMQPDGREVVRRLAATADVVVANLPDSALTAMRLDYASLSAVTPDIILTSVSAFGAGGPYTRRRWGSTASGRRCLAPCICPDGRASRPRATCRGSTSPPRSAQPSAPLRR